MSLGTNEAKAELISTMTDTDIENQDSPVKPRHWSGENETSSLPKCEATRRVKSQENLSASAGSDYVPLSSSKDTVILKPQLLSSSKSTGSAFNGISSSSFRLLWQRSFPCPVMGIHHLDIMGDGMEDLVIVTLKGLHILQVVIHTF